MDPTERKALECAKTRLMQLRPNYDGIMGTSIDRVLQEIEGALVASPNAEPFCYAVEQPDGHITFFKKDPTGFREKTWTDLGVVVHSLYSGGAPARSMPPLPLDLDTSPARMSIQIKAGELAELIRRYGRDVYASAQEAAPEAPSTEAGTNQNGAA